MIDKKLLKKLLKEVYSNPSLMDFGLFLKCQYIFINIFNTLPYIFHFESFTDNVFGDEDVFIDKDREENNITFQHEEDYDPKESIKNLKKEYKDYFEYGGAVYFEDFIVLRDLILVKGRELPERIKRCLVRSDLENVFWYVSYGQFGFSATTFKIKEVNEDILDNYNNDLPLNRIDSFINNESGLCLLHGIPGTGKSWFIRYLINKYHDKRFYWFESSLLADASSDAFVKFILNIENSILILEDCEKLLRTRESGNSFINTILNLSDGIIGDSLNLKFICTFNTDFNNIDKAVLRKGRMQVCYEFKQLTKDKVAHLYNKLGITKAPEEKALCDIYNQDIPEFKETQRKKIGF